MRLTLLSLAAALLLGGCSETIHHAAMDPAVLDFGTIDIGASKTLQVTFDNLEDRTVYVYFLTPDTFAADLVPAGDDPDSPFLGFDETLVLAGDETLTLDTTYECLAQDRGYFRWEITVLSALDDLGYWEATREVGVLTLKGTCGD